LAFRQLEAVVEHMFGISGSAAGRVSAAPLNIIDAEEHWIAHPSADRRLAPARAARADAHLPREGAVLDLAIEG
jgi:hypothetical protein